MKRMTEFGWIVGLGVLAGCSSSNAAPDAGNGGNSDDGGAQGAGQDAGSTGAVDGGSGSDGASNDAAGDGSTATLDDANDGTGFPFQPSNVDLSVIAQYVSTAQDVVISEECHITTSSTAPSGCGNGADNLMPVIAQQTDPATALTSTQGQAPRHFFFAAATPSSRGA